MTEHVKTKHQIKEIPDISTFDELLSRALLSPTEKSILRLHYVENKDFRYIGDVLGFSESGIKKKHCHALKIIAKLLK